MKILNTCQVCWAIQLNRLHGHWVSHILWTWPMLTDSLPFKKACSLFTMGKRSRQRKAFRDAGGKLICHSWFHWVYVLQKRTQAPSMLLLWQILPQVPMLPHAPRSQFSLLLGSCFLSELKGRFLEFFSDNYNTPLPHEWISHHLP